MEFPAAGDMNCRVTIKDWQDVPNADAGIDQQMTRPKTVWAKRETVGAAIRQGSAQINELITDRFFIRYRKALQSRLTKDSRFYVGNTEFMVRSCNNLKHADVWLVIECEEIGELYD